MSDRVFACYRLETPEPPERVAEIIAGEQSSGTFVALAAETPALKARSGARVEALSVIGERPAPSLTTTSTAARQTVCELTLSWPLENLGPSLPNLLSTVAGNLFELRCVTGLRVLELRLPEAFARANPGPQFGIRGTRRLAQVAHGPLIGTIIKPSVGLSVDETAAQVRALIDGGIDFIKDDELQADGGYCPFNERVSAVMREVNAAAERTGKKAMVAFNLTGEIDEMRRRHDFVQAQGGTCVMVCALSVGLTGLRALRDQSAMPIHVHRAGWGYLTRAAALGWDYAPMQMLWRLAGADHLHVNGLANKFSESDDSVITSARAVQAPLWVSAPMQAMPVFSSGQTGLQAAPTFAALGNEDLIHAAGGGIMGHPKGIEAGVRALRDSWEAARAGIDITAYAATRPALKVALEFWR